MILNTLKKRVFRLTDVKASALTRSQIDNSHNLTLNSMFNCMGMAIEENDISRVRDKRVNITSPTRECACRYRVV